MLERLYITNMEKSVGLSVQRKLLALPNSKFSFYSM